MSEAAAATVMGLLSSALLFLVFWKLYALALKRFLGIGAAVQEGQPRFRLEPAQAFRRNSRAASAAAEPVHRAGVCPAGEAGLGKSFCLEFY